MLQEPWVTQEGATNNPGQSEVFTGGRPSVDIEGCVDDIRVEMEERLS